MKERDYGPFPYVPITRRPPLAWPGGARLALWVIPNIEFFSLREAVPVAAGDRDIPVLGDVDVGHAGPNLPMPLGVRAGMDADALVLSLLEPAVTKGPN